MLSYAVGMKINWYKFFRKQFGGIAEVLKKYSYLLTNSALEICPQESKFFKLETTEVSNSVSAEIFQL